MVKARTLTRTEVSRRRRTRERLGLPFPGPGRNPELEDDPGLDAATVAYQLMSVHIDRYGPAEHTAARLAMTEADGWAVVIDGNQCVHATDPARAAELALGARRFARILPLAECRTQGAP